MQIIKIHLLAGLLVTLPAVCGAQGASSNRFQPHFSGQAPGEAQAIYRKFTGPVSAVDPKAMTLTIKSANKDRAYKLTARTQFSRGDKPASLKGVGVGNTVEVIIKMVHGQPDEVISVNIKDEDKTEAAPSR
jgi:hypothetical protein